MKAVEYGEMVQTNGKWVWRSTEEPVLKLMRDKGVITNERYNEVSAQTGKNWIEPADAVLNRRQEIEWTRYLKTATHLPDWVDLGLENRTRFESYDHPWRSNQVIGNGERMHSSPLGRECVLDWEATGHYVFYLRGRIPVPFRLMSPGISGITPRSMNSIFYSCSDH